MSVSVTLVLMEIAQRRMVKLTWVWFIPGFLITAAGIYYILRFRSRHIAALSQPVVVSIVVALLLTAVIWPLTIYIGRVIAPLLLLGIRNTQT
jgi:hypothetical protein